MSDYTWADFQRQENGEDPAPVSFTAEEIAQYQYENPDDQDCEVLDLVMEKDMAARASRKVSPCGCACCRGGFCGGCGHAGCGRRTW
jgi:hypothetical protein